MTPHIRIDFWAKSAQGWIQGRTKIGHGGPQRTSSSDWKATTTNRRTTEKLQRLHFDFLSDKYVTSVYFYEFNISFNLMAW